MTKIAKLLGLDPEATEPQILKALAQRDEAHTAAAAELTSLGAKFQEASAELEKLRALPKQNTANVNPEALALKLSTGLDKDKALTVLADQAQHDKTKPHDAPPKTAAK